MNYQWLSFKRPPKVVSGNRKSLLLGEEKGFREVKEVAHRHTALEKRICYSKYEALPI